MSFCQVEEVGAACDLGEMDIDGAHHRELDGPNRIERRGDRIVVTSALNIALRRGLPSLFATREIPNLTIVASTNIRDACLRAGLVGLHFVPVSDVMVVDFSPNGGLGFSKAAPHWRERRDLERWAREVDRKKLFDPGSAEARALLERLLRGELE